MDKTLPIYGLKGFQQKILTHTLQHGFDYRYNVPLIIQFEDQSAVSLETMLQTMHTSFPETLFKLCKYEKNYYFTPSLNAPKTIQIDTKGDELSLKYCLKKLFLDDFDLSTGPFSRYAIIKHGDIRYLYCVFHHLVVDGVTIDNLKSYIVDYFNGNENSEIHSPFQVPEKNAEEKHIQDFTFTPSTLPRGKHLFFDDDLMPMVKPLCAQYSCTPAELLLCLCGYLLKGLLSVKEITVPIAGRANLEELSATGCWADLVNVPVADSGNYNEDINSYREQFDSGRFLTANEDSVLYSFRVVQKTNVSDASISFLSENELFQKYELNAPNKIDLSFLFEIVEDKGVKVLKLAFEYNRKIYNEEAIKGFYLHLKSLMLKLGDTSSSKDYKYIPLASGYDVVESQPSARATVSIRYFLSNGTVQYYSVAEVRDKIDHFKRFIKESHIHTIVISAPKSAEVFSLIYACVESNICYVPVDTSFSKNTLDDIVIECSANAVATVIDGELGIETSQNKCTLKDIQYVIYTSGSTGKPKGVKIEKHAIDTLINGMHKVLDLKDNIQVFSYANLNFDMSVPDLFLPYQYGGEITFVDDSLRLDSRILELAINAIRPNLLQLTPTTIGFFSSDQLEDLSAENLIIGGEKVPRHFTSQFFRKISHVWNFYGPTEATVWCAYKELKEESQADISHVLPGYDLYLNSKNGVSDPLRTEEILIGGPISCGYVDSTLDNKVFISSKLGGNNIDVYATGDFAEYLPGEGLRIVGRADGQIKVNGVRIELGEIESFFLEQPGIQDCIASYDSDSNNIYVLVKLERQDQSVDLDAIRKEIPEAKRPCSITQVDKIPCSKNGKKDRRFKRVVELIRESEARRKTSNLTKNASQKMSRCKLESLIHNILELDESSVLDRTFYEHGGSSIKAISIVQELKRNGLQVNIRDIFESRKMSHFVDMVMEMP